MLRSSRDEPQLLSAGMQRMLLVASGLVLAVGIPLFLLTEQTDTYFAWTINSALTAAFLGAAYWSSCLLEFMAARARLWAHARVAVPAVLAFTALTLLVTLLHIDRFHFSAPALITRLGTWVWLAVYALVPVIMSLLLVGQLRAPGGDPPHQRALPAWARMIMLINGSLMLLIGIGLMIAPAALAPLWPWGLTELTGRAIGAWLIGLGIAAVQTSWEQDLLRVRPVLASAAVFALLQFVALARYPGEVSWGAPQIWVYLAILLDLLVVGAYGLLLARQSLQERPVQGLEARG